MGDRTWALLMTWMRKTSASRGRQSFRKALKIRFSPFWLKTRIPDNMVMGGFGGWYGVGLGGAIGGRSRSRSMVGGDGTTGMWSKFDRRPFE
jgi:hypothetical protein